MLGKMEAGSANITISRYTLTGTYDNYADYNNLGKDLTYGLHTISLFGTR